MLVRSALFALVLVQATRGSCAAAPNAPGTAAPLAAKPPGTDPDPDPGPDPDHDGVRGARDACPDEPGLASDGCPLRDSDDDGVLDPDDACPDQRECVNGYADLDGCPDAAPDDLVAILGVIEGLEFAPNKWEIRPQSYPLLDEIVAVLARYPEVEIEIGGHLDDWGSDVALRSRPARRRAEAVRDYMIHAGIDPARLVAVDYGEERPLESNDTAEGRARNRRIEVQVRRPPWDGPCEAESAPVP